MSLKKNFVANFINKMWSYLSYYIFVPVFLKCMGNEHYGIISFYTVLVSISAIIETSLTTVLTRQISIYSEKEDKKDIHRLEKTFKVLYFLLSIIITIIIIIFSKAIAKNYLKAKYIPQKEIENYLIFMGIILGMQVFSSFYIGRYMGLQKQVVANKYQIFLNIIKNIFGLVIITIYNKDLNIYFISQIIVLFIYNIKLESNVRSDNFGVSGSLTIDYKYIYECFSLIANLILLAILSTILTQVDKYFILKDLSIGDFSYYTIAYSLSQIPMIISLPIAIAIYPKLAISYSKKNNINFIKNYNFMTKIIFIIIIPISFIIIAFPKELVYIWTRNQDLANAIKKVVIYQTIGWLIQALTIPTYYTVLAYGNVKINIILNIISIIISLPLTKILINKYQINGVGLSWMIMNIITFFPYVYIVYKKYVTNALKIKVKYYLYLFAILVEIVIFRILFHKNIFSIYIILILLFIIIGIPTMYLVLRALKQYEILENKNED